MGTIFSRLGSSIGRFLDPVDPRNFNNTGGDVSLDIRSDWHPTEKDIVRVAGTLQGANFRIPNNEDQEDAGQRNGRKCATIMSQSPGSTHCLQALYLT